MPKDKQNFQINELGDLTLRELVKICDCNIKCSNCVALHCHITCSVITRLQILESKGDLKKKVRVPYAKIH